MAEKKGFTVIPPSQRPDGTWRKEIRVKAGYVDPEEAEKYQSRGKQWASKASNLPPGLSESSQPEVKKSKNQKKNERRKLKKLERPGFENSNSTAAVDSLSSGVEKVKLEKPAVEQEVEVPVSKDVLQKKIKGLKKKLRQIEDLESKMSSGEVKELTKEQVEKVSRKKTITDELEDLELDLKLQE